MKLVSYRKPDRSLSVGALENEKVVNIAWSDTLLEVIQRGVEPGLTSESYPVNDVKIEAPLRPGKIVAVGRNYAEHAAELGNKMPDKPLLFVKLPTSVIGTGDTIRWHTDLTQQVDWEGELAVVIGRRGRDIAEADAYRHIFGYTIANDVSARDLQSTDGQWIRAKGMDTFCPLGPAIVTKREVVDPHQLRIQTVVNGETMQDGSSGDMFYKIPFLIAYCSRAFTLEPGDILLTGTPSGVGKGMNPPRFLGDGDTVSVSITGLGTLTNTCKINPH